MDVIPPYSRKRSIASVGPAGKRIVTRADGFQPAVRASSLLAAVLLVLVLGLVSESGSDAAPAASPAAHRKCLPHGTKVVAQGREGRAYDANGDLYGCLYSNRKPILLAQDGHSAWFPPPAVAWAGPLVAYAVTDFLEPTGEHTTVRIEDLSTSGSDEPTTTVRALRIRSDAKVGSLRVRRNGGIAWIQCPPRGGYSVDRGYGDPRPNCTRPGRSVNTVYKHDSDDPDPQGRVRLDRGRKIDPRSLKLHGSRLTWREGKKRRSATLE